MQKQRQKQRQKGKPAAAGGAATTPARATSTTRAAGLRAVVAEEEEDGGLRDLEDAMEVADAAAAAAAAGGGGGAARAAFKRFRPLAAAAEAGDVEGMLAVLRAHTPEAPLTVRSFNFALRQLPPRVALRAWEVMREKGVAPDSFTATVLVKVLTSLRMLRHLDATMDQLHGELQARRVAVAPHWSSFMGWARAHAEAGHPDGVRRAMAAAAAAGLQIAPHYYTSLIKAHCVRGQSRAAEGVIKEMRAAGVARTEPVYRALMFCLGLGGHIQRAVDTDGITPGVSTYSALINCYADSSMPEQALQTLRQMRREGVTANVQAYSALMKAFAKVGDWRRCRAVLAVLAREGLAPNQQAWSVLVEACAEAAALAPGDAAPLRAARAAMADMRAAGCPPNVATWTSLLSAYGARGDAAGARRVLTEMRGAGVEPNLQTYTELMCCLGELGMHEEVQELLEETVERGLEPDRVAYAMALDALLYAWLRDKSQRELLLLAEEVYQRYERGPLPLELMPAPAGTLKLDLHGCSAWLGQAAVLSLLASLLAKRVAQRGLQSSPAAAACPGAGADAGRRRESEGEDAWARGAGADAPGAARRGAGGGGGVEAAPELLLVTGRGNKVG
eukprot:scaffold9.g3301.t1